MKKFYNNFLHNNFFFWLFGSIGILMLIGGFICPPLGVIDNSVLTGVGEIFAFAALGAVIKAIDNGHTAKIKHNDTEIEIKKGE